LLELIDRFHCAMKLKKFHAESFHFKLSFPMVDDKICNFVSNFLDDELGTFLVMSQAKQIQTCGCSRLTV
jgi:hypothetical protein